MSEKSLRNISKQDFVGDSTNENIKTGCLQRIADATEKMVAKVDQLERDEKFYRNQFHKKCDEINHLNRVISGYKGKLKQQKNKYEQSSTSKQDQ